VQNARNGAVDQILKEDGFDAVTELAKTIERPWTLGSALARVSVKHDFEAFSLLDSDERRLVQFAGGFARTRGGEAVASIRPWVSCLGGQTRYAR